MSIILCLLACIVSVLWVGPWLIILIGRAPFFMLLGGLAVALPFFWPWYLTAPPLICALLGATIAANWWVKAVRGPL